MITQQLKDAWLKELRDPSNKQTTKQYIDMPIGRTYPNTQYILNAKCMCASGALIKAKVKLENNFTSYCEALEGLSCNDMQNIVGLNDVERKSFIEIAEYVEKNVQVEG